MKWYIEECRKLIIVKQTPVWPPSRSNNRMWQALQKPRSGLSQKTVPYLKVTTTLMSVKIPLQLTTWAYLPIHQLSLSSFLFSELPIHEIIVRMLMVSGFFHWILCWWDSFMLLGLAKRVHLFSLLHNVPLYDYITVYFSILLLMDTGPFPGFGDYK